MIWALALLSLCLSGQFTIHMPLGMVPLSLQSLVVLFWAHWLPHKEGLAVIFAYLILGVLGLPVFAEGNSGLDYFCGPSLGYFLGFLLSPLIISQKALDPFNLIEVLVWQLVGIFFILTLGTIRLSFLVAAPLESGFSPFILPALIKAIISTGALYLMSRFTRLR